MRPRITRRDFLNWSNRPRGTVVVSCERLYMRYVDAHAAGDLPMFLRDVEQALAGATSVEVTGDEWLARDDFRQHIAPLLRTLDSARVP